MRRKLQNSFLGINKATFVFLLLATLFAFIFRFYLLPSNLFIGPEQGRDLLAVKDMVLDHKLTLIGPKTDIGGIFHGPFFYYLLTIPFIFSSGDPLVASIFLIAIQSITVIAIYFLAKKIGGERLGIISSLLFVVSFEAILYARWLSNPPLSIPCVVMAMLFLFDYLKGREKSLIGYSLFVGLLNQAEFLNLLFYSVFTICIVVIYYNRFKKSYPLFLAFNLLILILISVGTFILFDVRHQFLITKSVLSLFYSQTGANIGLIDSIMSNFSGFTGTFTMTVMPFTEIVGVIVFVLMLVFFIKSFYKQKEYVVLLLWLLIPLVLLIFLRHGALEQFFVSLIPAFIIFSAVVIDKIWSKSARSAVLVLAIILVIQAVGWISHIPNNKNIFFQSTQLELRYLDETRTIDRIYQEAGDSTFAIQAYTIPYWSQEAWHYLFWSYGSRKYGKIPIEQGKADKLFVIIQDDPRNVPFQEDWLKKTVSIWGRKDKEFRYGILSTRELKLK